MGKDMSISYEGVAEQVVTMKLDTTGTAAKEGDLVSLAANNTVTVSYTHLDVYKRQTYSFWALAATGTSALTSLLTVFPQWSIRCS